MHDGAQRGLLFGLGECSVDGICVANVSRCERREFAEFLGDGLAVGGREVDDDGRDASRDERLSGCPPEAGGAPVTAADALVRSMER